jgi:hypothetical protein
MGSVTPTVIPGDGYVRVEVNWQDFTHNRRAWIYRTVGGVDTKLRDGDYVWLSNGIAVAYDHEMPLDTSVSYKSSIPLNYNGDFESGVLEWLDTTSSGTVGTVTQSFDYWVPGTGAASLRLVPDGASSAAKAASEYFPVTVGTSYTFNAQMLLNTYWTGGIRVQIQWYNGTSLLSSSAGTDDFTPFPGVWSSYTATGTAPATATQARVAFVITGTPPSTLVLYGDEAYATTAAATVSSGPVVVPSDSSGWWTDPLHPATKIKLLIDLKQQQACAAPPGVAYLGVGPEKTRPADGATLAVEGAEYPVATWAVRKAPRSAMRVGLSNTADLARVKALHASGAPLLLSMNAQYGEPQQYQLFGDVIEGRLHGDQREQWRLVYGEFSETLAPIGPPEGTLKTRYVDLTKYATFAAATAAGATWLDALRGNLAT